jgi:hypothetical protein
MPHLPVKEKNGVEEICIQNKVSLDIGHIRSIAIECTPQLAKDGTFGKFERHCSIGYDISTVGHISTVGGGEPKREMDVTRAEAKKLLRRLKNYWGRSIVQKHTTIYAEKLVKADRHLPLEARRKRKVSATNWYYEIGVPPTMIEEEPKIKEMVS